MLSTEISISQAQRIVLTQQKFCTHAKKQNSPDILRCIEQMGYVQIDSISVIARAHHHSLFNRIDNYSEQQLDNLLAQGKVFEYWSHAAAYLPMCDYRYSLPRKQAIKNGEMHWYKPDKEAMAAVLARIKAEGPLMAKDFKQTKHANSGWWDWKPSKIALEQLFMQGDLMVVERRGFQKVYDLTDRVLPVDTDTRMPSQSEYLRHLILQCLTGSGLAKIEHICYLRKGIKKDIERQVQQLLEEGLVIRVQVKDTVYFALSGIQERLKTKLSQNKVRILSPFDNLVIQRSRMRELFAFDYQIECYVPAAKRVYGYFSLPLLLGQQFVGRMDVKVHRKDKRMNIQHLHLETENLEKLRLPLANALERFMRFQQVDSVDIERTSHKNIVMSKATILAFEQAVISNI